MYRSTRGGRFSLGLRGFWPALTIIGLNGYILSLRIVIISSASAIVHVVIVFIDAFGGLFEFLCSCTVGSLGQVVI